MLEMIIMKIIIIQNILLKKLKEENLYLVLSLLFNLEIN